MPAVFRPTVALVPRTTANCLDVAFVYFGRNPGVVLGIWLLIALPTSVLTYWFVRWWYLDVRFALVVVYFATLAVSVLLVNDAVPRLFGRTAESATTTQPRHRGLFGVTLLLVLLGVGLGVLAWNLGDALGFTRNSQQLVIAAGFSLAGAALLVQACLQVARHQHVDAAAVQMFFHGLLVRLVAMVGPALVLFPPDGWAILIGMLLSLYPGAWLGLRTGFLCERTCLARLDPQLEDEHTRTLFRREASDMLGRAFGMGAFWLGLWGVVFLSTDAALTLLFQRPVFVERLLAGRDTAAIAWEMLTTDPLVLATLTATALLTWPIIRLAWLFGYVDLRVRRDCWDLQFRLAEECDRVR